MGDVEATGMHIATVSIQLAYQRDSDTPKLCAAK